jgi:hypothetical protein
VSAETSPAVLNQRARTSAAAGKFPLLRVWRDPSHPAHDRLLLNPHTAFYCEQGCEEFRTKGAF